MANSFTKEHVAALDKAIAEKRVNPSLEFVTDNVIGDVVPNIAATAAVAAAVAALVGANAQPLDPASLLGKIPEGGVTLEDLIKARDHALNNS